MNEFQTSAQTGSSIYCILHNSKMEVWSNIEVSFVNWVDVDYSNYAIFLTEQGTSGFFFCDLPNGAGLHPDTLTVEFFEGFGVDGDALIAGGNYQVISAILPASTGNIRAVPDFRGTFIQSTLATLFLRITDVDGTPIDPESITVNITNINGDNVPLTDSNGNPKLSNSAEKISEGFFFFDWGIQIYQPPGDYTVTWSYTIQQMPYVVLQRITVIEATYTDPMTVYAGKVAEFRNVLSDMLPIAQYVAVYTEPARKCVGFQTYSFTFSRWNQGSHCTVYVNDVPVESAATINYSKGTISFDQPLTEYDRVTADYNFRWYRDDELDAFLSNGLSIYNSTPVVTNKNWNTLDPNWYPPVLDTAASYAIRNLMLRLLTQEAKLVFGGPEGAREMFGNLETLKKNFEDNAKAALDNKKLGSYRGLTRMLTVPEFNLPGGRSRWFRYLFSGGS